MRLNETLSLSLSLISLLPPPLSVRPALGGSLVTVGSFSRPLRSLVVGRILAEKENNVLARSRGFIATRPSQWHCFKKNITAQLLNATESSSASE